MDGKSRQSDRRTHRSSNASVGSAPLENLIVLTQQAVAVAEEIRMLAADDPLRSRELCYLARRLELAAMGGSPGLATLSEAAMKALDRLR